MDDVVLDERIRSAFEWLIERTPPPDDPAARLVSVGGVPRSRPSTPWIPVIAAAAAAVLVGVPLLLRAATTSPSTQPPPTLFVTSIPSGEILLGTGLDTQLYGFVTPEGIPCLRAGPLDGQSVCASPELWAMPGILNWQGFWGLEHPRGWGPDSGDAWVYGLLSAEVARVEFQFQYGPSSNAIVFSPPPGFGWGSYVVTFDADVSGLFTVVTAYDHQGTVLGVYDYRGDCADIPLEILNLDERLRDLCSP